MAYADFTLDKVLQQFHLRYAAANLFPGLEPVAAPPDWLAPTLARGRQTATTSEKARSEFIVAPILLAVKELTGDAIAIFSGERLSVDRESGLDGECDYILSHVERAYPVLSVIEKPVLCLVEAKKNDIEAGLRQCAAQMIGARAWNARDTPEGTPPRTVYGCVTTGETWQFLRLEPGDVLTLDETRFYGNDLARILAALLVCCV